MINKYIQVLALTILTIAMLASCNKEVEGSKVLNVTFHGYNLSNIQMEVSLDTAVFEEKIQQANQRVNFSMVYPYFGNKKEATLRVKDLSTGRELFKKTLELGKGQLEFYFNLITIGGNLMEVTPPAPVADSNKLGFYIYYPASNDPIDILLYNPNTGEQVYLAEKVVPQTWVYNNYLPVGSFLDKNLLGASIIYFLKAGTFDWAFNNDEYQSQTTAFSWYLPNKNFSGNKVQPYFILPSPQGWGVEQVNLFPLPRVY